MQRGLLGDRGSTEHFEPLFAADAFMDAVEEACRDALEISGRPAELALDLARLLAGGPAADRAEQSRFDGGCIGRRIECRDDSIGETLKRDRASGSGPVGGSDSVQGPPEQLRVWEKGAEVRKSLNEPIGVPFETLFRELVLEWLPVALVDGGKVAQVPESGRELDEVGLRAAEFRQYWQEDAIEAITECSCVPTSLSAFTIFRFWREKKTFRAEGPSETHLVGSTAD